MPVVNDKEREEIAQENVKKLHRMVLGEDKNINNDYVENFYVDMAKGVRKKFYFKENRMNYITNSYLAMKLNSNYQNG